jgi:hypothetical protein
MKWLPLIKRFPKWAIAGGIVLASCLAFLVWLLNRGGDRPGAGPSMEVATLPDFAVNDVVLAGNTLLNFRTGEVIAKQWLDGFNDNPLVINKVFAKEQLVIVSGNGLAAAFGFDGEAKRPLQADGMLVGIAAFDGDFDEVVFVRDQDLWHGSASWVDGEVTGIRKVTSTGYFRPDVFRFNWLWHEGDLLLPIMGKTVHVSIGSGAVKEVPVNLAVIEKGISPLGTFALTPLGLGEFGVVDLVSGETGRFQVGQRIRKFLFLSDSKAAIHIGNNQVAVYDHAAAKLEGPMQADQGIAEIAGPSPDGSSFIAAGSDGLTVIDLNVKRDWPLKLKFNVVEWISNDQLIASCDAIDTDQRGVWLVNKTGGSERISNQPMDSNRGGNAAFSPLIRISGGSLFISGGDLWRFDAAESAVRKVTQGQKLVPGLQLLQ